MKRMVNVSKIFLILISILLVQNKTFSYEKVSGKVSISVYVSKTDKSGDKSAEVKSEASANKSAEINAASSKDKSISKAINTSTAKNLSKENSYSDVNNDSSSDNTYGKNKIGHKINGYKSYKKFEIAKQERLFDAIKNFKNEKSLSKSDLKKIDGLVNRRIKEIAKKIRFKFDKDDEKQFFEFAENTNYDIEIIEKKAELVDYVQKTFEVMGIIN